MQVEIFVGQDLLADCNEYGIPGEILTEETAKKPSKTFYTAKINGGMMGTLIGCTDGIKTIKFITISPLKLQYNSKVPIVAYIPKEMDLRYRVWKADKKLVKPMLK